MPYCPTTSLCRLGLVALFAIARAAGAADPLPSWNDGDAKRRITEFVDAVTATGGKDFVPPNERIAAFDNDGTLWSEQPEYAQIAFMVDQLHASAPSHPEWEQNAAYKAIVAHDRAALGAMGQKPVLELLGLANSGMSVGAYDSTIREWLKVARHPKYQRAYTDLVYVPMQELLVYLRANGFKTFIVSGGSVEFMRPWAEQAYGIPPEQVVGSQQDVQFSVRDGKPVLTRGPRFEFVDDGPGKPAGIYRQIGRRPIAAFGNSDGDKEMLEVVAAGEHRNLELIVHHDDGIREYAYDRKTAFGRLDKAWDEAKARQWIVVSMKSDWNRIFVFDK